LSWAYTRYGMNLLSAKQLITGISLLPCTVHVSNTSSIFGVFQKL
jgi:hypothetical protein